MLFPADTNAPRVLGVVECVFAGVGGFDDLQQATFDALAESLYGIAPGAIERVTIADAATLSHECKRQAVYVMVVLEFVGHPLRHEVPGAVEHAAHHLGVHVQLLHDARHLANQHFRLLYMDLARHTWYREQTVKQSLRGRWLDLLRSKLAYEGVAPSHPLARKWRALRDCAPGTWGRGVADFYDAHGFPFPGEKRGIYELGARHDWVHVLADYGTHAEGEIDVFAFIAASMPDERGLVLLAFTLGLFQNGSINRVDGKTITMARADTLSDPRAVPRFADAFNRGRHCTVDPMGTLDLFAYKDKFLDALREQFAVTPRAL